MKTNFTFSNENFTIVKGDTLAFNIQLYDKNGNAFSETIENIKMACKEDYETEAVEFEKTLGDGISSTGVGQYCVRVSPSDTDINVGRYVYDIRLKISGDVYTVMRGMIEIQADVSNNI